MTAIEINGGGESSIEANADDVLDVISSYHNTTDDFARAGNLRVSDDGHTYDDWVVLQDMDSGRFVWQSAAALVSRAEQELEDPFDDWMEELEAEADRVFVNPYQVIDVRDTDTDADAGVTFRVPTNQQPIEEPMFEDFDLAYIVSNDHEAEDYIEDLAGSASYWDTVTFYFTYHEDDQ